jgi:hypothetical protein
VAKHSKGAPGIYELEPGLFKVVVSLGRDSTGRYRQHARTVRPRSSPPRPVTSCSGRALSAWGGW